MTKLTTLQQTRFPGIPAEGPFLIDLLVRVQAPAAEPRTAAPRPPLHLAVVLDRSGSMSGEPLREACRCAAEILGRLGPQDRLGIVTYDNRAQVLRPCLPVTDPDAIRKDLAAVRSGGNTDLHLGWDTGVKELLRAHRPEVISRVLLLSDGQANAGMVAPEDLAAACAEAQAQGVSTSTYGLGEGFGEEVMTVMARHGQGRSYYGETADDLLDPFMEEFDLLSNLEARGLTVVLATLPGLKVTQRNGYLAGPEGGWRLPDLPALGEAWALFRLEGDAAALAPWISKGEVSLGTVAIRWRNADGQEEAAAPLVLRLKVLPSAVYMSLPEDPLVARRVGELAAADLQEEAHRAARDGDWARVRAILDELKVVGKDNAWTQAVVGELETLLDQGSHESMAKELFFCSTSSRSRIAEQQEDDLSLGSGSSYLRRKKRQGKKEPPETES